MLPRMPEDDPTDEVRVELRLARRELKFVRAEQARMAEQLQRVRRQRARLKEQAEVVAEVLAAELSEAYWRRAEPDLVHRVIRLGRPGRPDVQPLPAQELEMVREVEASELFDAPWYLRHNLDAARQGLSPAAHYVRHGGPAGRDPSELFDTKRFLARNAEARTSGLPPLVHHLRHPDPVLLRTGSPDEPDDDAHASGIHL
jgi:hypothetical protein